MTSLKRGENNRLVWNFNKKMLVQRRPKHDPYPPNKKVVISAKSGRKFAFKPFSVYLAV